MTNRHSGCFGYQLNNIFYRNNRPVIYIMTWRKLFFIVTAALTSLQLCNGHDDTVVQRPSSSAASSSSPPGSVRFRSLQHQTVAPTRRGSLTFRSEGQSDQTPTQVLHNLMKSRLKRMDLSVQCSDNLMTLKVKGVRSPHFLVDTGEGPVTPLSKVPSQCGFSVKRTRRDVHFAAPYQGCHVTQQDGNYVLPLRLWGSPMTMSCPAVLPPPSVSCFPSGMVVKIGGVTRDELKVKVSGMWKPLSSVCSSCGLGVEVISGGLMLAVPYNRGPCVDIEGEEYLLSLLPADVELLITCPSLLDIKPTTTTTTTTTAPPQYPQQPQFPMFPQHQVFPQPTPPPLAPAPTTAKVAPLPQHPQLPSGASAGPENQEAPSAHHSALPFMPQYPQFPQFPQYPLFPRPVPPMKPTAPSAQLPQMPQSPQYPFPFFLQFPQVPGIFHPTTPPPPSRLATTTEALVTTPAPTTKPRVPQQPQFPVPPQYPYRPFPKLPPPPKAPTHQDPKPGIHQPKPHHVYPQTYQMPVLYPPPKYPSQRQNIQTAAPTTTSTTTAATTPKPAPQQPFYYPHPYMPAYYVPQQQAPMPVFPDPPTTPPANPAPSDQHKHQPVHHAMPRFYHFPSHQWPKSAERSW